MFTACGISHQSAPIALRERIALPVHLQDSFLQDLIKLPTVNEALFLSTCNRTEIYCDTDEPASLNNILAKYCNLPAASLSPHWYIHEGEHGLKHALRVASGLDSMMIGEPQILGQLKQAYHHACETGAAKTSLKQVFPSLFRASKRIRTQSGISRNPVSIAYAAAQQVIQSFASSLSSVRVFIIGSGDTATLVTKYLHQAGVQHFFITSRTEEQAKKLAAHYPAETVLITDLPIYLKTADIVITATACPIPFITKDMLQETMQLRNQRPLLCLDLAVPRNITENVIELPDVQLYNIDSLQSLCQAGLNERKTAAIQAEQLIDIELEKFVRQSRLSQARNLICHYRDQMQTLASQELSLAMRQLEIGHSEQKILETLTYRLLKKLTHLPTMSLRLAAKENQQALLDLYSQQLGFRLGANERAEGVYKQYMTDGEQGCNNAENSSAKSIYSQQLILQNNKPSASQTYHRQNDVAHEEPA